MVGSAFLVSFSVEISLHWWAFIGFFVGHVIWATYGILLREKALFGLNFLFLFVDLYAILIRML